MCHYFVNFFSWDYDWAKGLLCCFWLCDLLILVFAIVLQTPLMYLTREEIIELYLHNFLSHMSALFVALQFDEGWNIIWLLSFSPTIALVESRKHCSYFHWLPIDFFENLTCKHIVFYSLCPLGFYFHVIWFKVLVICFTNPLLE